MSPGDAIVDGLACYRLTRLVTRDTITRPLRARVIRSAYRWRAQDAWADGDVIDGWNGHDPLPESEIDDLPHDDPETPKLAAFIICPFCVGLWISFGVVVARRYASRLWEPVARALALSAAAALIAGLEDG